MIGIDVVEDSRLDDCEAGFYSRVFHQFELSKKASVFAIKEAVSKVLGIVPPPWLDIAVRYEGTKPVVELSGSLDGKNIECSVSHCDGKTYAVAVLKE